MVWKQSNQNIENIEQIGDGLDFKSSAVDMRGWITGKMNIFTRKGNLEYETLFKTILKAYNHYHPERIVPVEIKGWHGKSSFEIIKEIDKLVIIKYQRANHSSEPIRTQIEASKKELESLIYSINYLWKGVPLETKHLAFEYCMKMNIKETPKGKSLTDGEFWTRFFAWRSMHNKFTLMLDALDKLGFINYSGGFTTLNKKLEIQEIL